MNERTQWQWDLLSQWGLAAALVAVLLVALPFLFSFGKAWLTSRRFDPVVWRAGSDEGSNKEARIHMVDDLLRRYQFRGMTREQVVEILGEPDKTEYFKNWDMVYWLGPERGFMSIDSEWLVFSLNPQKKISVCRIVRD